MRRAAGGDPREHVAAVTGQAVVARHAADEGRVFDRCNGVDHSRRHVVHRRDVDRRDRRRDIAIRVGEGVAERIDAGEVRGRRVGEGSVRVEDDAAR